MSTTLVLTLAFAIGVIAGLRSFTAPAVVSWAAHWNWLNLQGSPLAFLGSAPAAYVLTALAIGELIADKLPKTPSRKAPGPFIGRIVLGALSGAALGAGIIHSIALGAVLGGLGGVVGTLAGYEARTRTVKSLNLPDFVVALVEDAIAIAGAFFVVSRSYMK